MGDRNHRALPKTHPMNQPPVNQTAGHRRARLWAARAGTIVALAGCTSTPLPPDSPAPSYPSPAHPSPPLAPAAQSTPPVRPRASLPPARPSAAATPRDYRRDAAAHLYGHNADRIFQGKLPPNLYAIGVLQVDVDSRGNVSRLNWMRAPTHAPEVVAEIERTVRQAAPFPAPARMGRVTYTDVWLWDSSGRFQLDTLTEGQL